MTTQIDPFFFKIQLYCYQFEKLLNVLYFFISAVIHAVTLVSGQQQYFRITPKDVTIHEGQELTLHCEVGNLAGAVQWTKDGYALGKYFFFLKFI